MNGTRRSTLQGKVALLLLLGATSLLGVLLRPALPDNGTTASETSEEPLPALDAKTLAHIDSLRLEYRGEAALAKIVPLIPRARAARG